MAGSGGPRIALVVAGSRGDAQPFVALAKELQRAGARPVLLTHAEHAGLAAEHGVAFRTMPGDPRELLATQAGLELLESRSQLRALRRLRDLGAHLFDDVTEALERELPSADAVVFSTLAVSAYHVGEALGIPAIWAVLQPVSPTRAWPSLLVSPGRDLGPLNYPSHYLLDIIGWRLFGSSVAAYRRRAGLAPLGWVGPGRKVRAELPVVAGWSQVLAPRPSDWHDHIHVTGAWQLASRAAVPTAVERFLADGPAPVYMGLGSATVARPEELSAALLGAARDVGVRVLLSGGWAGLRPGADGGGSVLEVGELPHDAVFGRCAAVVHHAGAGTAQTALAAGAVSVSLPLWGDQPFWARRLQALGVAPPPVPRARWSRAAIGAALARAVGEPWRRERAGMAATRMAAEGGAAGAAQTVLRIVTTSRGR
ncbi:MAG: glycosyltransferase [Actinobacteria bacterium]|nr:MAG: glycosyltransferase [Actinomycetota bacterium]